MCSATTRAALGRRLLATLALLAGTSALAGPTVREERRVAPFQSIEVAGPADLVFTQGTPQRVLIEAEARVIARLGARTEGGMLRFDYGPAPFVTEAPVRFLVTAPALARLRAAGSGDVRIEHLDSERFTLEATGSGDIAIRSLSAGRLDVRHSGAGNVDIGGRTGSQRIASTGSGDLRAAGLASERAEVRASGSGDLMLRVTRHLDVRLSGSGDLYLRGQPRIEQHIAGTGELLHGNNSAD